MNHDIQAIIFDFDGTILNTEAAEFMALHEVFTAHGAHISHDDVVPYIGGEIEIPWVDILTERATSPIHHATLHITKIHAARRHVESLTPRAGILDLLAEARAAGVVMGIASNAPRNWVDGHINRLGIRHYFDAVRGVDDVSVGKPHPGLYLDVCRLVGADPDHSIAIEDSAPGAAAAVAAGLTCIACPTQITRHANFHPAAIRVDTLDGVKLHDLATLHQQRIAATRR